MISLVIIYVITLWGGAKGAEHWRTIRGYGPALIQGFDEVTDSAPTLIDNTLDKLFEAQWDKMLTIIVPELVARMTVMVDEKLAVPPQEVNIPRPPSDAFEIRPGSDTMTISGLK